jgi:hypothetical protein
LQLEACVQGELYVVPALPATVSRKLGSVIVEALSALGHALAACRHHVLFFRRIQALGQPLVWARRSAHVRELATRLPTLADRTQFLLHTAVDTAPVSAVKIGTLD